jgi:hypothetical protein
MGSDEICTQIFWLLIVIICAAAAGCHLFDIVAINSWLAVSSVGVGGSSFAVVSLATPFRVWLARLLNAILNVDSCPQWCLLLGVGVKIVTDPLGISSTVECNFSAHSRTERLWYMFIVIST